jgi:16S rRNA G966 N2-methylase RsmD
MRQSIDVQLVPIASIEVGERYRRDLGDIAALARSIEAVGLLHPIVIDRRGRLIAGQRRLAAFMELGRDEIPAHVVDLDAVVGGMVRGEHAENVVRKDFTRVEAIALGGALEPLLRAQADARRRRHGGSAPGRRANTAGNLPTVNGRARDMAAAAVGMKPRTYAKAKAVVEAAEAEPTLFGDLPARMDASGNVDGAHKELERRRKQASRRAIPDNLPRASERFRLLHGSLDEMAAQIEPDSVDAIITDPPYPLEYLPLHETLARVAARVLKPGGSLLAMVGHIYLPDILALMTPHLRYQWTLAYVTGSPSVAVHSRKALVGWKPVLWFVKGDYRGDAISDVCRSDRAEKGHHDWGQSESGFDELLHRFARPGDTVLDPFVGGGTCAVVALARGCRFIGIDVEQGAIATTAARIAAMAVGGADA